MARRVPFVFQMEAVECGAACLTMILGHHGYHAPLSEVRHACGVSRDGATAHNIVAAAESLGLEATASSLELDAMEEVVCPAILHWDMNHFVVLDEWTSEGAFISDPGVGRRFVPVKSFGESFTGICIELEPGEAFKVRPKERRSRAHYLALLRGAKTALGMILVAALAIDLLATAVPLMTQVVIDHVVGRHRTDWLFLAGGSAAGLVTFAAIWSLFRAWLLLRVRRKLDVSITEGFVAHLLDLPMPFFAQRTVADLMGRVQASTTIRDVFAGQSVGLLADGVMLFAFLGLMFAVDARLAGVVLAAGIVYAAVFVVSRPLVKTGADNMERARVASDTALLQILRGITTIKSAGVERTSHERWLNAWISSLNTGSQMALRQAAVDGLLFAVQAVVPIAVLFWGGLRVLDGAFTPGRLVAFQMLQAGFLLPLSSVIDTLLRLQVVPVLLDRMDDVLTSDTERKKGRKCPRLRGGIVLENVTFAYSPTSEPVLRELSLRIEPGSKVALVGPSGSGKSTVARLLLGLAAPTEGRVLLDGEDLAELELATVRRQFGVVLQEVALFTGTVADNLRLFAPNAPIEHVVRAARVAQIHDDIVALQRGYDTTISAGGGPLSGGQRQRLALARAILHRPPVMILDEATSALDSVTEAAIERYLATRACTRIVIAHRMSTVRDADMIFVLDGGEIVEQGRHDELLEAGGLYARLIEGEEESRPEAVAPEESVTADLETLATLEALKGWGEDEREELAEHLEGVECPAETRIVEQDARATGLYFLLEGTVAIELSEPGLPTWTVAELPPGAVFGEVGLLDGSPSSASVVARTAVRLLHLPYATFVELQKEGDVLAARLSLSLGAIVAERIRDTMKRHAAARTESRRSLIAGAIVAGAPEEDEEEAAVDLPPPERRQLPLTGTLLGATLDQRDTKQLDRLGSHVTWRRGETLFEQAETADTLFVLLAGHVELRLEDVGRIAVGDPGAILGETSAFDAGAHSFSAIALDDVVAFALPRDAIVDVLLSGQSLATKILPPIAESLVRRFRIANFRLREAMARRDGELERAHAAREQAQEAAGNEREALVEVLAGAIPTVIVRDPNQTAAASLLSILRANGRRTSLAHVSEALEVAGGEMDDRLPAAARSLGLRCRRLDVPLAELRPETAPLLVLLEDDRALVLVRRGLFRIQVMDPMNGLRWTTEAELGKVFSGRAFELRDKALESLAQSLPERVSSFALERWRDLARLLLVSVALELMVLGTSLATALVVARVFPFADRPLLTIVVAAAAALGLSLTVGRWLRSRAIEHLRTHFDRELLDQLMIHVLKLPIAFFDRFPAGELLQRFRAFENVRLVLGAHGVAALLSGVSLVIGGVLLFGFAPRLTVVGLVVLAVYLVSVRVLFRASQRAAAAEVKARGDQQGRLIELLQGITTLRIAGARRIVGERWLPWFLEELDAALRREWLFTGAVPVLGWVRGIALVVCVWSGAREVLAGTLSLGMLVAFLGVLGTFLGATHALAVQALSVAPTVVDYGLVKATFDEPREQTSAELVAPGRLRGRLALEHVSFRYTEDGPLVLEDVSLEIESGMKVALVGTSGSGKSTLGRLLLGLYLPTGGRILFDGKDVTSLDLEALRRQMGVVLQEPFLLAGSIRENIALGGENATLERVMEAARQAAIHDDIEAMGMGYETLVAEGGASFSGGQRQRIVIARALVSRPAVLLLDEATSALDNLSQAAIENHLADSPATRIVIAHRLSTVVDADRIVVMDKGRVVEVGTHDELVERRGRYYELVRAEL